MFAKYLMTSSLVAAVALTPMTSAPAQAQDARDVIGGLLLGGAIAVAIGATTQPRTRVVQPNQPHQPRAEGPTPTHTARPNPPRPAIPSTESGRQLQTALNYFGFNAGTVDGQVGPATRTAVERYQSFQGYRVDGRDFPEVQSAYLYDAYRWATNGGAVQSGMQGSSLLLAYERHLAGNGTPALPTHATVASGSTVIVTPAGTPLVAAPGTSAAVTTVAAPAGGSAVPNLFAGASAVPVLSQRCAAVAMQGQANGAVMTLGTLSDPHLALSEQFCGARADAVAQGEDLTQAIANLSPADITAQCLGFSTAVAPHTAMIGAQSPQQAMGSAQGFAYSTGIPQAELAGTARVCLGVGYGNDDMEMALGSALMLVASGEPAYGELIAHHMREGFGLAVNTDTAGAWYDLSLTAVEEGAPAVFSPSDTGRVPLIRQAVAMTLGGQPVPVPAVQVVPAPAAVPAPVPVASPAPAPAPVPVPVASPAPAPAPVPAPVPVSGPVSGPAPVPPTIVQQLVLPSFEVSQ